MDEISSIAAGLGMIAAFLLLVGGGRLALNRDTNRQVRTRGALMIVAALVILMNVMIWTV